MLNHFLLSIHIHILWYLFEILSRQISVCIWYPSLVIAYFFILISWWFCRSRVPSGALPLTLLCNKDKTWLYKIFLFSCLVERFYCPHELYLKGILEIFLCSLEGYCNWNTELFKNYIIIDRAILIEKETNVLQWIKQLIWKC